MITFGVIKFMSSVKIKRRKPEKRPRSFCMSVKKDHRYTLGESLR